MPRGLIVYFTPNITVLDFLCGSRTRQNCRHGSLYPVGPVGSPPLVYPSSPATSQYSEHQATRARTILYLSCREIYLSLVYPNPVNIHFIGVSIEIR